MNFYADFKEGEGFRCHPCQIIEGPLWDDLAEDNFYKIKFIDFIKGTIDPSQIISWVPVRYIFETAIELVDLPKECYWNPKDYLNDDN